MYRAGSAARIPSEHAASGKSDDYGNRTSRGNRRTHSSRNRNAHPGSRRIRGDHAGSNGAGRPWRGAGTTRPGSATGSNHCATARTSSHGDDRRAGTFSNSRCRSRELSRRSGAERLRPPGVWSAFIQSQRNDHLSAVGPAGSGNRVQTGAGADDQRARHRYLRRPSTRYYGPGIANDVRRERQADASDRAVHENQRSWGIPAVLVESGKVLRECQRGKVRDGGHFLHIVPGSSYGADGPGRSSDEPAFGRSMGLGRLPTRSRIPGIRSPTIREPTTFPARR